VSRDTGLTLYDVLNSSEPDGTKKGTGKMVVTCNNKILKFYFGGALKITHDLGSSNIIDQLKIGDESNYFEYEYLFSDFVMSESEAINKVS